MDNDDNVWPHKRPAEMTEMHVILLKEFWKEGQTPTTMIEELGLCCPNLTTAICTAIVMNWMWQCNFVVKH